MAFVSLLDREAFLWVLFLRSGMQMFEPFRWLVSDGWSQMAVSSEGCFQ